MASEIEESAVLDFVQGGTVWLKWDAARRLMAARQMQAAAARPEFQSAFNELGGICAQGHGTDQLLAIALVVRISELVKGELKVAAAEVLSKALTNQPDPFWTISDTKEVPTEAKPSEIRENIALALTHASGSWVIQYVIEALAREDKSARCRLELCRQLVLREPQLSRWIEMLNAQPWSEIWKTESSDRAGRLRDLAGAMTITMRSTRTAIAVDENTGPALATLMQKLLLVSPRLPRPPRLADACLATVELLDEILATEFTLIADPESYAPLAVLSRWWQSSSYPAQLSEALVSIARKLTSAIRLRARLGQRSETLSLRLRQALGSESAAADALASIAQSETGLDPAIEDWLCGRERESSSTSAAVGSLLSEFAGHGIAGSVAPLLLDCTEAMEAAARSNDLNAASELRRLCGRIQSLAVELKLGVIGRPGEMTEFNSAVHRTLDGSIPSEPMVRIIRPIVIQRHADGSQEVVERAVVGQ